MAVSFFEGVTLTDRDAGSFSSSVLADTARIGLFFSAGWCGPCRAFAPLLVDFYNTLFDDQRSFEIVLISLDKNEDDFFQYMREEKMPWYALPPGHPYGSVLGKHFAVETIPCLVIVDEDCREICLEGRQWVENKGLKAFEKWMAMRPSDRPVPLPPDGSRRGSRSGGRKRKHKQEHKRFHESPEAIEAELEEELRSEPDQADAIRNFKWKNYTAGGVKKYRPRTNRGFDNAVNGRVNPIHVACREGNIQMLRYIMKRNTDPLVVDQFGRTPLHYAAMHGGGKRPEYLTALMDGNEWKEMMNMQDNDGNLPLHHACRYGHVHMASFLLQAGPGAVEVRNVYGRRPYDEMHLHGHAGFLTGIIGAMLPPQDVKDKLAAKEIVNESVDTSRGAKVKHQRNCDRALLTAVLGNDVDEVRFLLETTPADPLAIVRKDGMTIMDHAIAAGDLSVVRVIDNFLNPEAPVNIDDFDWDDDDRERVMAY